MSLLKNLQGLLTGGQSSQASGNAAAPASSLGNLAEMLGPAALGGLLGAFVSGGNMRKMAGNALLVGGGAILGNMLWDKYKDKIKDAYSSIPGFGTQASSPEERSERLIRAMVFAAKSDGHLDEKEYQAIQDYLRTINAGPDAERIVQEAMAQPLDPGLIANGVQNEEEALEVYLVSCAAVDIDHFMERSYLDALALALKIPAELKAELEAKAAASAAGTAQA